MSPFERLARLEQFGIKFGLENMRTLCAALEHPERAFRSVLVAGTNGKGSVTAMVAEALRVAGYRSARYTSPHLVHLAERYVVDGATVDEGRLASVLEHVLDIEAACRHDGRLETPATHFEVATAVGLELFRNAGVDVAVLEVGLGGRFDATNVVPAIAGVITTIDLDHTRFLGRTIAEIATEKAGIVKRGMSVVTGERKPEAVRVFEEACRAQHATLVRADEDTDARTTFTAGETDLRLRTPVADYGPLRLALRGAHQVMNAAVSVRLLETLAVRAIDVPAHAIVRALSTTRWPGRLQRLQLDGGRELILDGAHNPAGASALATWLQATFPGTRVPVVFAAMSDKDVTGMLGALKEVASQLVITEVENPRRLPAVSIAETARAVAPDLPVAIVASPGAAVERALAHGPLVCVAGSLFLVGAVLNVFGQGGQT
ncbi:MAG: bifunctional folylpolyglutamate synthase/dihydrofolate synthase [Luteitalea sp.]|nr:bifunctional folylpolyglutamate synthase/dihydrofolate synthase [Luteitalea sp.]